VANDLEIKATSVLKQAWWTFCNYIVALISYIIRLQNQSLLYTEIVGDDSLAKVCYKLQVCIYKHLSTLFYEANDAHCGKEKKRKVSAGGRAR
jgi:hypothetical protein